MCANKFSTTHEAKLDAPFAPGPLGEGHTTHICICQKSRRIGCVMPHWNLLREIAQRNPSFEFFDISVLWKKFSGCKWPDCEIIGRLDAMRYLNC